MIRGDATSNSWRKDIFWAVMGVVIGVVGTGAVTLYTIHETKESERAALKSEAAFLCHAMSWQAFYLASDQNPDSWRCIDPSRAANEECKASFEGANTLTNINNPSKAWARPSWFPLRTPVWTVLKDKVGDLEDRDAGILAPFFNRVEFLDVLRKRRHCYRSLGLQRQLWTIYMCSLRGELRTCSTNDFEGTKSLSSAYTSIADAIEGGLHCKDVWSWQSSDTTAPSEECDADILGAEGSLLPATALGTRPKPNRSSRTGKHSSSASQGR